MTEKFETIVDYIAEVLEGLLSAPSMILLKPVIDPLKKDVKTWLENKHTQNALLNAAKEAEDEFCIRAKEKFKDDRLVQAVISLPVYNNELFQSALKNLPEHFSEEILANHLSNDLLNTWKGEFSKEEIRSGVALYLDCLRVHLLKLEGFADIVAHLSILRTDRRTEEMQADIKEIRTLLQNLQALPSLRLAAVHQIPPPPADFIGREDEIKTILDDIDKNNGALILGMGGVGKTALGLVIAQKNMKSYPDAQIYIDMQGTSTPISASDAIIHTILSFEPNADLGSASLDQLLGIYRTLLSDKKVIIFIDNVRTAEQVKPLIPPLGSILIVTSRWQFPVPGLQPRRINVFSESDASKFLLELSSRIGEQARELADALGNLPLALRIAGSFLQVNVDAQVLEYIARFQEQRLSILSKSREEAGTDEPDVKAIFELTYKSFAQNEQYRWRALGVFSSSFDQLGASSIWELDSDSTQAQLSQFLRYSFLEYDPLFERYHLHDLLTEFAVSNLSSTEKDALHLLHAKHYCDALKFASYMYSKGDNSSLLGLLLFDLEWSNIQAGQKWISQNFQGSKDNAALYSKYTSNPDLLNLRLHVRTLIDWMEQALIADREIGDRQGESVDYDVLGNAYAQLGDISHALDYHEKALKISKELNNRKGESVALGNIGNIHTAVGDAHKAISYHERALIIDSELADFHFVATDLLNLGQAYAILSDVQNAVKYFGMALETFKKIGDLHGEANTLNSLGGIISDFEPQQAGALLNQALEISRTIGDRMGEADSLANLGKVYMRLGNSRFAIEFYTQALSVTREFEDRHGEGLILSNLGRAYQNLGLQKQAIEFHEKALEIDHEVGDRNGEAIDLGNLGLAYADLRDFEKAIECFELRIKINRETGDLQGEGLALNNLGLVYKELGNKEMARKLFQNAIELHESSGSAYAEKYAGIARRNLIDITK